MIGNSQDILDDLDLCKLQGDTLEVWTWTLGNLNNGLSLQIKQRLDGRLLMHNIP